MTETTGTSCHSWMCVIPSARSTKATRGQLARRLTDVLIRMEGGADTRGGRTFAWVISPPSPADDWWVGGRADDAYVVAPREVSGQRLVPEGYMNGAHKNEVHAWVDRRHRAIDGRIRRGGCRRQRARGDRRGDRGQLGAPAAGPSASTSTAAPQCGTSEERRAIPMCPPPFRGEGATVRFGVLSHRRRGLLPSTRSRRQPPIAELPRL